jgi:hypothetical protein
MIEQLIDRLDERLKSQEGLALNNSIPVFGKLNLTVIIGFRPMEFLTQDE